MGKYHDAGTRAQSRRRTTLRRSNKAVSSRHTPLISSATCCATRIDTRGKYAFVCAGLCKADVKTGTLMDIFTTTGKELRVFRSQVRFETLLPCSVRLTRSENPGLLRTTRSNSKSPLHAGDRLYSRSCRRDSTITEFTSALQIMS